MVNAMRELSRLRASDRIKELEGRLRELEAALREIDERLSTCISDSEIRSIARAALEGK